MGVFFVRSCLARCAFPPARGATAEALTRVRPPPGLAARPKDTNLVRPAFGAFDRAFVEGAQLVVEGLVAQQPV
ncbi:hypothetical protein GCM10022402_18320 [Salinactinospora qingdaonensis]|uniref:Uncharacterized protein n=1 Tax=Salinactinospora qingdaonensis TaxID=702744 RepID=A0ABP7FFQ9_9ACTN